MSDERQGKVGVNLPVEEIRAQMREDRRFRAACAAIQGLLANGYIAEQLIKQGVEGEAQHLAVAAAAVELADSLLAALDKPVGGA